MKRLLSLTLCAILLLGVAIPVYALNTEENPTETTVPSESVPETTAAPTEETKEPQETEPNLPTETTVPGATSQETPAVTHIDGCSDDCTKEDCACPCHEETLFEKLMETDSLDEYVEVMKSSSEEEFNELTEDQLASLNNHLVSIMPKPEVLELPEQDTEPVPSEVVFVTVNCTNVAPIQNACE